MLANTKLIDHSVHALLHLARFYVRKNGEATERRFCSPARIDVHQLGEISDSVCLDVSARIHSRYGDLSLRRPDISEHERNERAFSSSIRTRDAEHFTFSDT